MEYLNFDRVQAAFDYAEFVDFLALFLANGVNSPDRLHYSIPTENGENATLLMMPAWIEGEYIGIKIATVFPGNIAQPTINGNYTLISGSTGQVLCLMDGLALTIKRTAAVSALASRFLSDPDSASLLMIGTGNMCHELIKAHTSVRPIRQVWIASRDFERARHKAETLQIDGVSIEPVHDKDSVMMEADIVSCATMSDEPVVHGRLLKDTVYLDLVGSFKKMSREADDEAVQNANIYVDTFRALDESGDLYMPVIRGIIPRDAIRHELSTLCKGESPEKLEIFSKTIFKSVGFAASDLAAATYLYKKISPDLV